MSVEREMAEQETEKQELYYKIGLRVVLGYLTEGGESEPVPHGDGKTDMICAIDTIMDLLNDRKSPYPTGHIYTKEDIVAEVTKNMEQ
jgi:hypothetical protein